MENDKNDLQQKYQLLAAEFAKVRAQCGVLKKAVVEEQKKSEQLQRELNERDQLNRKYVQEIDSLGFRNQQLTKRVEALQSDAEKEKTARQSVTKDSRGRIATQVAEDINVLRRELEVRITENEALHAKLIETENDCRQRLSEAENKLQTIKRVSESSENALLLLRATRDKELDRLNEIVSIQELKNQEKDRIIDSLSQKYEDSKHRIEVLERERSTVRERVVERLVEVRPQAINTMQSGAAQKAMDDTAKSNDFVRRFELKGSVNEAMFLAELRVRAAALVDALTGWLPPLTSRSTSLPDTPSGRDGASLQSEVASLGAESRSTMSGASNDAGIRLGTYVDDSSLIGLLDAASTFFVFKLVPTFRVLRGSLRLERDIIRSEGSASQLAAIPSSGFGSISAVAAAGSSKHAKLIVSKLDSLLHCVDALTAVSVRCAADLLNAASSSTNASAWALSSSLENNDPLVLRTAADALARPLAIGALIQVVTDSHTLVRRYSKLHSQRVSLLYAALRSSSAAKPDGVRNSSTDPANQNENEMDAFASLCDRLEAEQIAVLNCENLLETLLAFLKESTSQTDETRRSAFAFVPSSIVMSGDDSETIAPDEQPPSSAARNARAGQMQPSNPEKVINNAQLKEAKGADVSASVPAADNDSIKSSLAPTSESNANYNPSTGSVADANASPSENGSVNFGKKQELANNKRKKSAANANVLRIDGDSALRIETLQAQTRLLEAQLRECVKRLQLSEAQKRSSVVQLVTGAAANDSAVVEVRSFYEDALSRLTEHVQVAHARTVHFAAELSAARTQLRVAVRRLGAQTDELTLVRTKYEQQLAAMSDHLAELNSRVASQHEELGVLRRRGVESTGSGRR